MPRKDLEITEPRQRKKTAKVLENEMNRKSAISKFRKPAPHKKIGEVPAKLSKPELDMHVGKASTNGTFAKANKSRIQEHPKSIMAALGIDNMDPAHYRASSVDQPQLVHVHPVSVLQAIGARGLFAATNIPAHTILGVYTGKTYSPEEFDEHLNSATHGEDNSYAMNIDGKIVDAFSEGNFTRYANFSDCQDNVDFVAATYEGKKVTKLKVKKDVRRGQQLLVDYNVHNQQASEHYFFLNPDDGWESAGEVYKREQGHYVQLKCPKDYPLFSLVAGDDFVTTQIGKAIFFRKKLASLNLNPSTVNLRTFKVSEGKICDYHTYDSFSALMTACYFAQVDNVKWLINNGANVDQQQNQSGNCPLFFALHAYADGQNAKNCLQIIEALIAKGCNAFIHDRKDRTFLHLASEILGPGDFKRLLAVLKALKDNECDRFFTYVDNDSFDVVLYCLKNKAFDKANALLQFYPRYFKNYFSNGKKEINLAAFQKLIEAYSDDDKAELESFLKASQFAPPSVLFTMVGSPGRSPQM